jgi:hypothetical protein
MYATQCDQRHLYLVGIEDCRISGLCLNAFEKLYRVPDMRLSLPDILAF